MENVTAHVMRMVSKAQWDKAQDELNEWSKGLDPITAAIIISVFTEDIDLLVDVLKG